MSLDPFAWLSEQEFRYLAVSEIALLGVAALAVYGLWSQRGERALAGQRGTSAFLGAVALALFASRWPTLFLGPYDLDQDTAEFIAQALAALHDPVPWRGFDGLTAGPLDTYIVAVPALLGLRLSFETTAAMTLVLQFVAIVGVYGALCETFGARVARIGAVPPLVFWAVTQLPEFVYYSSGLLSAAIVAAALWLLACAARRGFFWVPLYLSGVLIGSLPLAKLQSAPLGAAIASATFAFVWFAKTSRIQRMEQYAAGLLTVPALVLGAAWAGGSLPDFWTSYVLSSLAYVLYDFPPASYLFDADELGRYVDWLLVVAIAATALALGGLRSVSPRARGALALAFVAVAATIYCIFAPKRPTLTYLVYAVIPFAILGATALGAALERIPWRFARNVVATAFVVVTMVLEGGVWRASNQWATDAYPHFRAAGDGDDFSAAIARRFRPGERLATWGWRPKYFVLTGTAPGTRDAITVNQFETFPNPYRPYFRQRYIEDFVERKPDGFFDAGDDSWKIEGTSDGPAGYETFPELAAIVNRDYVLVDRVRRFRLFIRRDLASRPEAGG